MAILSAIAGGIGALGSAIYGAVASGKANRRAQQLIQQQKEDNKRWYETKMSQDYTLRTDAQAAINRQRELLDEQYKRAKATNVVAGGTDESVAMQKEAANKALGQTISDVAANASNYKDNVEKQYQQTNNELTQQQAKIEQQQASAIAKAAGQAVGAGINVIGNELHNTLPKSREKKADEEDKTE